MNPPIQRARLPYWWILTAAALQAAASPPGWLPNAAPLVIPGLALQYAIATSERRPLLASYWFGVLYTGAFSFSLRHVLLPGWLLIALVGGLYTLASAVAVRSLQRWFGSVLWFAIAVAGACFLRAELPQVWYPHGQPCHDFWRWPSLLGAVRIGGEPLANALLAAVGAALFLLSQTPRWRSGDRAKVRRRAAARMVPPCIVAGNVAWQTAATEHPAGDRRDHRHRAWCAPNRLAFRDRFAAGDAGALARTV